AEAGWSRAAGRLELRVVVPPNTTATVHLPEDSGAGGAGGSGSAGGPIVVGSGEHVFSCAFRDPADDPAPPAPPARLP
ncbi:alpha-L-rhamnosidase C-terminal domain-containing protein, partial [Nonomuraea wenchangensis]